MYAKKARCTLRRNTLVVAMLFTLAGCLPSGQEDVADGEAPGDDPIPVTSAHRISGSVGDGPVVASSIVIRAISGVELGTSSSDSMANFDATVETQDTDYPLQIESNDGTDLVTSSTPDFTLRSAVLDPEAATVANLNPFTTIAMETARDLSGGINDANVISALEIVSRELNSGLDVLTGTAAMDTPIDAGNIAELMRASEALGEVVRRTRDRLASAGVAATGNDIVDAIGSDLVDGVLDGRGGPRSNVRIAAIAGVSLAQVALEAMQNQLQVQGSDAMIRIENATAQVFAGIPIPTIAELRATQEMLDAARAGVLAANVLQASPELDALLAEIDTLSAGMSVSQLRQRLASNPVNAFVNSLTTIANASDSELAQVTEVLRGGDGTPQNTAPEISGTPLTRVEVGASYSFTPSATDADGDNLSFSVSGQPLWTTFDNSSGELSGIPAAGDTGSSQGIVISVSDGQDSTALPVFTITVSDVIVNTPPVIADVPATTVVAGDAYSFTPTATDADGDALSFGIQGKPAWASFNNQTGELNGTPDNGDSGNWAGIVISVSDGASTATLPAFAIDVQSFVPPNRPPQISGTPGLTADVGSLYSFTPGATDADGDSLSFSISGMPSWATFRSSDGRLRGTPGAADAGSFANIVISVSDGQATASLPPFAIVVSEVPNTPPEILGDPATEVLVGSLYRFDPTATDADGDSLTFSVNGLPSWATFDDGSGRISGTPASADEGVYSGVSVSVSDGTDSATLGPFTITVNAVVLGSATLTWTPPTENTDGTPLTDLAGYRIYWGTAPGQYTESVTINNPGLTTYVVENLVPGSYEFVSTALNSSGVESDYSNRATKVIN